MQPRFIHWLFKAIVILAIMPLTASADQSVYLAQLTVDRPGIRDNESTVGTVTLSTPSTKDFVILLKPSSPGAVSLPGQVTIRAGQRSSTFVIRGVPGKGTDEGNFVTISGTSGLWMQATDITVVKATTSLTVSGLMARPGNHCVQLHWTNLPESAIHGFRVYRRKTGSSGFSELTHIPISTPFFVDAKAVNGVSYEYQVVAVEWNDKVSSPALITCSPSRNIPPLAWGEPPTVDANGWLSLSVQAPLSSLKCIVLVDGKYTDELPSLNAGGIVLDTKLWKNGAHTVQVVVTGDNEGILYCAMTQPVRLKVNNPISEIAYNQLVAYTAGELFTIEATIEHTSSWTLTISHQDGATGTTNPVRSWTGNASSVRLAWDGKATDGTYLPGGNYSFTITSGTTVLHEGDVWLVKK